MAFPSYLEFSISELKDKVKILMDRLERCDLCGRKCMINRYKSKSFCNSGVDIIISSYGPHFGEESIISGTRGSGTLFFTNCPMKCVYCQNYTISQLQQGYKIDEEQLASIMLELQQRGCHNINLVTPTHFAPQIFKSAIIAIENGLKIPFVYNCGGYENPEVLKIIEGFVDIYMPDAKYGCNENGYRYSGVIDYWDVNKKCLIEMKRQVGDIILDDENVAKRGLLIRHLALPNDISCTENVLRFIKEKLGENTWISLLSQYHPEYKAHQFPEINRTLNRNEYRKAVEITKKYGFKNVLYQGFLL